MAEILSEQLSCGTADEQEVELVERKGLGHPDSICDAIANRASVALCQQYTQEFGRILHHNLDKALLIAGRSTPALRGGTIDKPMRLVMGDRATLSYKGKTIDVASIVDEAAKGWIRENLRFVDPHRHLVFQNEINPGSPELTRTFERDVIGANDTSAAVGFAPLSSLESVVLSVERHLNSAGFKRAFPETGEDVKIMGVRRSRDLHLTVAMALVDRFFSSSKAYFQRKDEITGQLLEYIRPSGFTNIKVGLNTLDDRSSDSMYLTVLGISAEGADSGQVGRGNRANGLISITRPQGMEAHSGKNPVNHIGKIYSYFSHHLARRIHASVPGIREVYVYLSSQIGRPVGDPMVCSVRVNLQPGVSLRDTQEPIDAIVTSELTQIDKFTIRLASHEFYEQWEAALDKESAVIKSEL